MFIISKRYLGLSALLILLIAAAGLASGCASGQAKYRGLNENEAEKLMATQAAKEKMRQEDLDGVNPTAPSLEAHGDQLAMKEEYAAAIFQYQRALTLVDDKDKTRLQGKSAILYLKSRQWRQAADLFGQVTKADDKNPEAWQGLGLALLATGELDESWQALIQAINLDPKRWKAHNGLGMIYNYRDAPEQAVASFKRAIALRPLLAPLHNNLGLALSLKGDLEASEKAFRKALLLDPENKRAYNNLGMLLARQNRDAAAISAFSQSVGQAKAHNNLGVVKAWGGDSKGAIKEFNKAIAAMPRFYDLADRHKKTLLAGETIEQK